MGRGGREERGGYEAVWTEEGRGGSLDRWREEEGSREGGEETGRREGEMRQFGQRRGEETVWTERGR